MRIRVAMVGAGIALASMAGAQQAPTIQQQFEAAAALAEKGDNAGALAAWNGLDGRTASNKRSHAIVLVRKSAALLALDRKDEAVRAARAGLAGLPADDATLRGDRYRAYFNLGRIAENAIDYASAAEAYGQAESVADTPQDKIGALFGLSVTQIFVDPAAAGAALTRADAIMASAKVDPMVTASFARQRGLLFLNQGNFAEARRWSAEAVRQMGGLTMRTDVYDVSARSDAALASLLAGDGDTARKYMAYTGAGRLTTGTFDPGAQMKVPDCGGEAGLKPADMAVIEFSIGEDGTVISSEPIYAAGGGAVALEFARAARDWSWTPEQVKQLPPFFRYNARVELRCSTAFPRPSIGDILTADLETWLATKGVSMLDKPTSSDALASAGQRAALAAAEAKGGLATIPALYALATNAVVGREETNALARRMLAIVDANGAPPSARLRIDLIVRSTDSAETEKPAVYRRLTSPLLTQPVYANDPKSRAVLRLFLADSAIRKDRDYARTMLEQVADDAALAPNDPLRIGALIRIASLDQAAGDAVAARAAFEKSGLAANQCAIIDSGPHLINAGGTFPSEAMMWGFEGWTQTQFDVTADGKVVNERAIMSYPPFVFTKAGNQTIASARYSKTYRPDGSLGCGASTQRVRFALPNKH